MALHNLLLLSAVLANAFAHTTCLESQPRKEGDPTGQQITDALNQNNAWDNVCSGNFPPLSGGGFANTNTWNHGSLNMKITRESADTSLANCKGAFQEIISTCIMAGNTWGGIWSGPDPEYSIFNDVWPNNPLAPTDNGGPSEFQSKPGSSPITLTGNAGTGPITIAPQTALESGTFSTTTTSIAGLTANSVTTTTDSQGHPTILPVWWIGTPDTGVIVIPVVIVGPQGVVPPPPGLPPIIIGPNGEAENGPESLTSTTSTRTTSSEDARPTFFEYDLPVNEDALQKFAQEILASQKVKEGTATQLAEPIESPKCTSASVGTYPTKVATSNGDVTPQELLIRLRQQVCAGPCTDPEGVVGYAGIATDDANNYCEVSVGISKDVEAYMYRGSPAVGVEWQQCWDSTMNIINNCVKDDYNTGWWNGDHVYQFYQGGLRSLNDPGAKRTTSIKVWLPEPAPDTSAYTCYKDCRNYVPNEPWCLANCPCFANEPHVC